MLAGVRLNETFEHKFSTDLGLPPPPPATFDSQTANKNVVRPSETIGASWRAWADGGDEAVLYADFRDAFKPAAIDFGPDYTPDILNPETAQSYEIGVKGAAGAGLVVATIAAIIVLFVAADRLVSRRACALAGRVIAGLAYGWVALIALMTATAGPTAVSL